MQSKKITFYFVRHGESEGNVAGILSGHLDVSLTPRGVEQAKETARIIPSDYEYIYSSDLLRCKQTAEIVNVRNLPIQYDARLRERCFGTLEGRGWKELDPEGTLRAKDVAQQYDYRPQGGESADDVEKRIFACIADIKSTVPEHAKVLIVAHGGVIRLLHAKRGTLEHEHIPNASVHEFEL